MGEIGGMTLKDWIDVAGEIRDSKDSAANREALRTQSDYYRAGQQSTQRQMQREDDEARTKKQEAEAFNFFTKNPDLVFSGGDQSRYQAIGGLDPEAVRGGQIAAAGHLDKASLSDERNRKLLKEKAADAEKEFLSANAKALALHKKEKDDAAWNAVIDGYNRFRPNMKTVRRENGKFIVTYPTGEESEFDPGDIEAFLMGNFAEVNRDTILTEHLQSGMAAEKLNTDAAMEGGELMVDQRTGDNYYMTRLINSKTGRIEPIITKGPYSPSAPRVTDDAVRQNLVPISALEKQAADDKKKELAAKLLLERTKGIPGHQFTDAEIENVLGVVDKVYGEKEAGREFDTIPDPAAFKGQTVEIDLPDGGTVRAVSDGTRWLDNKGRPIPELNPGVEVEKKTTKPKQKASTKSDGGKNQEVDEYARMRLDEYVKNQGKPKTVSLNQGTISLSKDDLLRAVR
jgi:hypothetical protein